MAAVLLSYVRLLVSTVTLVSAITTENVDSAAQHLPLMRRMNPGMETKTGAGGPVLATVESLERSKLERVSPLVPEDGVPIKRVGDSLVVTDDLSARDTVLVLMADSRINRESLTRTLIALQNKTIEDPKSLEGPASVHYELAFALNGAYAMHYGYDFAFVQLEGCPPHRNVNWCKIGLIRSSMDAAKSKGYSRVLYVDSDAYFNHWWSVNDFLEVAENYRSYKVHSLFKHDKELPLDEVSLVVPSDIDFDGLREHKAECLRDASLVTSKEHLCGWVLNMGIELWRAGLKAQNMLDALTAAGERTQSELADAEQGVLRHDVFPKFYEDIALISSGKHTWHADEVNASPNGKWITHVHKDHVLERVPMMARAISSHAEDVHRFLGAVISQEKDGTHLAAGFVTQTAFMSDIDAAMHPWVQIVPGPRQLEDDGRPKYQAAN